VNPRSVIRNGRRWLVNGEDSAFWDRVESGDWEPLTYDVLDRFLDPRHSYVDVGAWIGPTLLYGAQLARHCYALEPDPVAFARLQQNLLLNPSFAERVTLSPCCITPVSGPIKIGNKTSPIGGDSMSSLLFAAGPVNWRVLGVTLDSFAAEHGIRDCSLLKIDIEGGEFEVLPAIADYLMKYRPTVYLALHPRFLRCPEAGLAALRSILSLYRRVCTPVMQEVGPDIIFEPALRNACYDLVLTDVGA
jgi:FkbM family methyltransferase